ncbi:response regulator transcription factor [Arsukibacterium sp.]|uniref:helix-turn-helix transcriptional regulator n=1 Tax=Arsukibacterium sp. TaxID=1977258 RepID=UPI00299F3C9F|nr:response regulator transcription factor [Arsukibacterium sp.]MDX1539719.1 response regulator transcription factor [Arsukibacterium sp.]
MAKVVIYTAPGFKASSWHSAFSEPIIYTYPVAVTNTLQAGGVVLIHSARSDWQALVQQLSASQLIIVISQQLSIAELQLALTLGGKGYIDAGSSSGNFTQAANTVSSGALWIPATLLNQLNQFLAKAIPAQHSWPSFESRLSKREYEVASLARQGLSNKSIAEHLFITERTVKQHLTATFAKLGIKDRLQLIMLL